MIKIGKVQGTDASTPGMWLAWSARGLKAAWWEDASRKQDLGDHAQAAPLPSAWEETLRRYLQGAPVDLASLLPVDVEGTAFQERVWQVLRTIPWGEVRTYGEVARAVGSPGAVRAVGRANGANPLPVVIPCHRVVAAGGRLGGYSGGLERKRWLLSLEGVQVEGEQVTAITAGRAPGAQVGAV